MKVNKGNYFIPVICEETGWYGTEEGWWFPNYLDVETARKYSFIYLEQRINSGKIERRSYG